MISRAARGGGGGGGGGGGIINYQMMNWRARLFIMSDCSWLWFGEIWIAPCNIQVGLINKLRAGRKSWLTRMHAGSVVSPRRSSSTVVH